MTPDRIPLRNAPHGSPVGRCRCRSVVRQPETESRSLHLIALQALVDQSAELDSLIVIDQFEEVFTQCRSAEERTRFLALLETAARADNSRTRIVLGIRTDFYVQCTHPPGTSRGVA